ncbi:hypothetical protein IQ259_25430 [Fortiea sp. LEGE XX443]|uniref:hypothetical protein n=1 Tax=Fortiea sp. LEGE XX443 TaxID=1828611 RepID=UPI0018817402|nr:hypothetical protein [Fortiea sp. LEGE XX443]MBE9008309.1 hypothetical protein [Fortiea sp. LEGE XX443]
MSKNIKAISITMLIFTSILSTYIFLGKFSYMGSQTLIGITEGADVNVPYNHKYGILGYAFARNYYQNGEITESRIQTFDHVRFAFSVLLTIGVWGIAALIITKFFIGNKEITDSGEI